MEGTAGGGRNGASDYVLVVKLCEAFRMSWKRQRNKISFDFDVK
jgi:hypothetical protein